MIQHDIRNDLLLIVGYLDMLEEHVTDEGLSYLETVDDSARDAIAITGTAPDLSETILHNDTESRSTSLRDSIPREVDEIRSIYEDETVDIEGTIPDVSGEADDMLDSVFRNVLKNAIQHNDKAIPELSVSATQSGDYVEVRFADNGPGIPDERKSETFGRGENGHESGGTGIGTFLIDKLVTRYGGSVRIEDNEPEGVIFVVTLSIAERE